MWSFAHGYRVDLREVNIDKNFIEENYLELFDLFQRKSMEIKMYFKQIIESEIYDKISSFRYREVISEIFSEEDFVYAIYNQKIHVGFSQEEIGRAHV